MRYYQGREVLPGNQGAYDEDDEEDLLVQTVRSPETSDPGVPRLPRSLPEELLVEARQESVIHMKTLTYTDARKNAMDLRQYLALRVAKSRHDGSYGRFHYHIKNVVRQLTVMTGLPAKQIREDLAVDVATIEALEELAQ